MLEFDESFRNNYANENYFLTFHFSRMRFIKQHYAVESAPQTLKLILFPDEIQEIFKQVDCNASTLPWINQSLNDVQKRAVINILQGVARPLPYIIFGPPG